MKAALCPLLASPNPSISNSPVRFPARPTPSHIFPSHCSEERTSFPLFPLPARGDSNRGKFNLSHVSSPRFLRVGLIFEKISRLIFLARDRKTSPSREKNFIKLCRPFCHLSVNFKVLIFVEKEKKKEK